MTLFEKLFVTLISGCLAALIYVIRQIDKDLKMYR